MSASSSSLPAPTISLSKEYKLEFHKAGIEKLQFDEQTSKNERVKKWKIASATAIRTASGGKTWLLDMIYSLVIQDGHVYMHSKAMDAGGGLGARKTDILKKIDLQDPINSDSQVVLEHVFLCGAPITNDEWTIIKGDKDKSRVALFKLIEFMNVFSDEISKTTLDAHMNVFNDEISKTTLVSR
jgi:hypothetical protein